MSQHDYVISNATGAAARADINTALLAIVSLNSGVAEPATMYAYMMWADTATGLLKQRNGSNDAWITLGPLSNLVSMAQLLTAGGDIIYASAANTPARLPKGAAYKSLNMNAAATLPEYQDSLQSLLGAQSIIAAVTANIPVKVDVAEQRVVGRKTGGNIDDLTASEVLDMVSSIEGQILQRGAALWAGASLPSNAIVPQTVQSAYTDAHGFPDFLWNGQEDFAPVKVPTGDAISGGDYAGGYYAYQAFDGSDSTRWQSSQTDTLSGIAYIGLKNLKRNIKAVKYLNYSTAANNMTSVKVQYSTDGGVTWTDIQTETVVSTASCWNEFDIAEYAAGDAGLHSFRLLANANLSGSSQWIIYTLILLYNSNLDVCTTGNAVKYDENGSYPATNAFNNDGSVLTPYHSTALMNGGLTYLGQSGIASAVKAIRVSFVTANTCKEVRLSWKQNVGDGWTDLATVATDTVSGWQTLSVPSYSPSGSHYFAIRPTTNCSANSLGVYEMEFYLGDDTDISMTASATDPLTLVHSSGKTNYITEVTSSDTTLLGASLVPGRTGFIYADRNASTGAITYGSKPVCPQYGKEFDVTKHCLLHFEGADASTVITDEYGSTWTVNGNAQIDNNATPGPKFGSTYLRLDGTGDSIKNTDRYWFNGQPFTIEGWWFTAAHTTANQCIVGTPIAGGVTWPLYLYYTHDTLTLYMSSNGASWDLVSALTYTFTGADNTWYKFILEWDGYYYRLWWGTSTATMILAMNIKSSTPLYTGGLGLEFGAYNNGASYSTNGGMDEIRITLGSNRYGWSPVAEVAAFDKYDSDMTYFDINKMKMYYGGGTSWTEVQRLFLGEAYMDAHGVTDMRSYALQGKYVSALKTPIPAASAVVSRNHNLGVAPYFVRLYAKCLIANEGYTPGDVVDYMSGYTTLGWAQAVTSTYKTMGFTVNNASTFLVQTKNAGTSNSLVATSWGYIVSCLRGW